MDPLRTDLCHLCRRVASEDVRLLLVGGYGILLKAEHIRANHLETVAPTLFPRATDDLDLLLTSRVVTDIGSMEALRASLRELGYEPVTGGEFYQWFRELEAEEGAASRVRIDLPGQIPEDRSGVKHTERRIRPHDFQGLHAHPVVEAAFAHKKPTLLDVCPGPPPGTVAIPHRFSFLLLKLFAFHDRRDDPDVDQGRHHAYDLRARHGDHAVVRRARRLIREHFSDPEAVGSLRLREHVRRSAVDLSAYPVDEFLGDLQELVLE